MSNESQGQDSLEFLKSLWGNLGFSLPGMVTPTVDADELGKRIADLKAVEGWLKMNLNMLQTPSAAPQPESPAPDESAVPTNPTKRKKK